MDADADASGPTRVAPPGPSGTSRARRLILWAAVAAAALLVVTGSLLYTEQSSFCPTCHEMKPYYDAWQAGPHAAHAQCVDCHIDGGLLAHLAHKPSELTELWDHFFGNSKFPNYTVDMPNSRCIRCHATVPEKAGSLFSHSKHVTKATCKECHSQAGHTVSLATLDAAGILKANAATPTVAGMTPSSIAGHIKVICQECHNQAVMRCSACHQPPHENRGECSNCHQPGTSFLFQHTADADCASCHKPPANHYGTDCIGCHSPTVPFAQTRFTHPQTHHDYRSRPCVKCHPNGYATAYCTCHHGNPPSD
jgi:nitrate/TMAO reductase-like tetraheme cytochrome c subunit